MDTNWNPWKMTAIGMALVVVTALVTTFVVSGWPRRDARQNVEAPAVGSASPSSALVASAPAPAVQPHPVATVPPKATTDACNRYAANRPTKDKTLEVVKDGAIGAA